MYNNEFTAANAAEASDPSRYSRYDIQSWQNDALNGRKVEAIKTVRALTGFGLKEAKEAVEYWVQYRDQPRLISLGQLLRDQLAKTGTDAEPKPLPKIVKLPNGDELHIIATGSESYRVERIRPAKTVGTASIYSEIALYKHLVEQAGR